PSRIFAEVSSLRWLSRPRSLSQGKLFQWFLPNRCIVCANWRAASYQRQASVREAITTANPGGWPRTARDQAAEYRSVHLEPTTAPRRHCSACETKSTWTTHW